MHIAFDPDELTPQARHKLTIGSIVPRPIAWTTSVDPAGRLNLAPFSYFMACHSYLPAVAVSIGSRADTPSPTPKDTSANIRATGEFVINIVSADLVEKMNVSAAAFPTGTDEARMAGVTTAPSVKVAVPRIAESPISVECRLLHALTLGEPPRESTLFVGTIVMWHIRQDLVTDDYRIDQAGIRAVARMGGRAYTLADDLFELAIPDWRSVEAPEASEAPEGSGRDAPPEPI